MKFSLITRDGAWMQNHIGTSETAAARARRIEDVNHYPAGFVVIVPELSCVVPWLSNWRHMLPESSR